MEISLDEFNELKNDVSEIKDALIGSKFSNNKGLLWVMEDHHRRLCELEKYRDDEIVRLKFQQDKDRRTQNLIKTFLAVITILSIVWTFYKSR